MAERKCVAVLPVPTTKEQALITEPERQLGGPQSGLPPAFEIAQELAPYLIVGIDFGTIDCRVATFFDNAPRPLKISPIESHIHFPGYAVDADASEPTTINAKEVLGKPFRVKARDQFFTPVDIAMPVLQRVKRDSENTANKLLAKAVITTPACATHTYRQDLLEAAALADINVIGLLNETTALGIYWTYTVQPEFTGTFIVLSLGKTHWEAAIMTRHEKLLEVRAHNCRDRSVDSEDDATALTQLIRQLTEESHTPLGEIDAIAIGGRHGLNVGDQATILDTVRATVPTVIPPRERLDHRAAAAGAAIFAALIVRQTKDLAIWDCLATATMVGEEFSIKPLIAPQSPIPISGHFNFKATSQKAQFQVMQRTSDQSSARSVCSVVVEDIPATTDTPRSIDIEIHATADGTLSFNARDIQLDSNLKIKIEPTITEYEVMELVQMKAEPDVDIDALLPEGGTGLDLAQIGIAIVQDERKWIIEMVDDRSVKGKLVPGMVLMGMNGIPIFDLPYNPNRDLIGTAGEHIEFIVQGEKEGEAKVVSLARNLSLDSWQGTRLEQVITESLIENNYVRLVTALIMYGHCKFVQDTDSAASVFDRAVHCAKEHLGAKHPLYSLAVARKAWFHLKRYLALNLQGPDQSADQLVQLKIAIGDLVSRPSKQCTDAHAKYIYELVNTFTTLNVHQTALKPEAIKLIEKAIDIAKTIALPASAIDFYEKKLAEVEG